MLKEMFRERLSLPSGGVKRAKGIDPRKAQIPEGVELVNTRGVCLANSTAYMYAAVIYHHIHALQNDALASDFLAALFQSDYGRLLLSLLKMIDWSEAKQDDAWKCSGIYRYSEFSRYILDFCEPLKQILEMPVILKSQFEVDGQIQTVKETLFGTYGLTLHPLHEGSRYSVEFIETYIEGSDIFPEGVDVRAEPHDTLKNVYFEKLPMYIRLSHNEEPEWDIKEFFPEEGGGQTQVFDFIPLELHIRDIKGRPASYNLIGGIISIQPIDANREFAQVENGHGVALARYNDDYFIYDNETRSSLEEKEFQLHEGISISVVDTEKLTAEWQEFWNESGFIAVSRADFLIYAKES